MITQDIQGDSKCTLSICKIGSRENEQVPPSCVGLEPAFFLTWLSPAWRQNYASFYPVENASFGRF